MAKVRNRNTGPELLVRQVAHSLGLRFRLHRRDLPGSPDVVFPKYRIALFVHGCFWHQHYSCKRASRPKTNSEFWETKLERNIERDQKAVAELNRLGWRTAIIWECETKNLVRLRTQLELIFNLPSSSTEREQKL